MTNQYPLKLYVIGDTKVGVLFITIDPLRAAFISNAAITAYTTANPHGKTSDQIWQDMEKSARSLIFISGNAGAISATSDAVAEAFSDSIQQGTTISDVKFCFATELQNNGWEASRNPFPPLHEILKHLSIGAGGIQPSQVYGAPVDYTDVAAAPAPAPTPSPDPSSAQ